MGNLARKSLQSDYLDTKDSILDKLGDLSGFEICNNEVLLAIYMRPETTVGGIILPSSNLKEDLFQAKAHLVVKMGPTCDFPLVTVKLYDWVMVRPADGWAVDINAKTDALKREDFYPCRMVMDRHIKAKISHPGMIW
jgi:hypothetical protein